MRQIKRREGGRKGLLQKLQGRVVLHLQLEAMMEVMVEKLPQLVMEVVVMVEKERKGREQEKERRGQQDLSLLPTLTSAVEASRAGSALSYELTVR